MSDFLPKGYDGVPETPSQYMKFQEGKNPLRVLSSAVVGWEWFTGPMSDRTCHRVKTEDEIPQEVPRKGKDCVKHFWGFIVYNYNVKEVQVLVLKQKSIMNDLEDLIADKDWGDLKTFDVSVNKKKTGPRVMDVEYSVMPRPKAEFDKDLQLIYGSMKINLEALYEGKDPFEIPENADTKPKS